MARRNPGLADLVRLRISHLRFAALIKRHSGDYSNHFIIVITGSPLFLLKADAKRDLSKLDITPLTPEEIPTIKRFLEGEKLPEVTDEHP